MHILTHNNAHTHIQKMDVEGDENYMLAWHEPTQVSSCVCCMYNTNGDVNGKVGAEIEDRGAHDRTTRHKRRVRHLADHTPAVLAMVEEPGAHYTPPWQRNEMKYECLMCSLDPGGVPRDRYCNIAPSSYNQHVTGKDHNRRCEDGRLEAFNAIHGNEAEDEEQN
jgi:hypothetical protein